MSDTRDDSAAAPPSALLDAARAIIRQHAPHLSACGIGIAVVLVAETTAPEGEPGPSFEVACATTVEPVQAAMEMLTAASRGLQRAAKPRPQGRPMDMTGTRRVH